MYSSRQSTCEKKLAGKYAGLPVSSFWQLRQQRPPGGARRPLPFVEPTSLPFRSRGDLSSPTREPYFANSANEAQLSANIVTKKGLRRPHRNRSPKALVLPCAIVG